MKRVKSICALCNCDCGIIASVDGGRLAGLEGDPDCLLNRGSLCPKGRGLKELVYDPDRVTDPMRRTKSGRWEKAGWDSVLEEIADRISLIADESGPEAVALYQGTISKINTSWINRDFMYGLGSPNYTSVYSLCVSPREISAEAVFGRRMTHICDFARSRFVLIIGGNPAASGMHRYLRITDDILNAVESGAKLVVVDPRYTETARKADLWVPIRPGTDLAFVLGLLHVIIEEGLYDTAFVSGYCRGFGRLREVAAPYTPAMVSQYTGVPADTVAGVARGYASAKPACVDRRQGVMHQPEATLTNWAISALAAVCGNVDTQGGVLFRPDFPLAPTRPAPGVPHLAHGKYPFANAAACLPDAILSGRPHPVRALVTVMGNPVTAWPNTAKVLAALEKLELLVCVDLYLNEAARLAHYFLPGVTCLERYSLSYSKQMPLNLIRVGQPVISPVGGSRPEDEIICDLARRLNIGGFDGLGSQIDIIDRILMPSGRTTNEIVNSPGGLVYAEMQPGRFLSGGFPTPSGKIELCPENMPIPTSFPATGEGVDSKQYPYHLVAGFRLPGYYHSTLMNLPGLRRLYPAHQAEIAADIAGEKGIEDGDTVEIITPGGSARLPARVVAASFPGVVAVHHGFGGRHGRTVKKSGGFNVNYLTGDLMDPVSATPAYRRVSCDIKKVKAPPRLRLRSERCTGCGACLVACGERNSLPPGVAYLLLIRDGEEKRLKACLQCESPRCAAACSYGAWKKRGGVLVCDPGRCTGCGACLEACPYQAVLLIPGLNKAGKCSLCADVEGNTPACAKTCPTGAIYVD